MPRFSPEKFPSRESEEEKVEKETFEISPEIVEELEKSNLTPDGKVNLLLTKAGLKPASEIDLVIRTEDEEGAFQNMEEEEVEKNLEIVKDLNIPCKIGERKVHQEEYETEEEPGVKKEQTREKIDILIGHTQEDLDRLIKAEKSDSDELLGEAFGYPSTVVEAFVEEREKLDLKDLPEEIRRGDAVLFSSPTLSESNWREEIKQGQRYADFIKEKSPKIYQEMKEQALRSRQDEWPGY